MAADSPGYSCPTNKNSSILTMDIFDTLIKISLGACFGALLVFYVMRDKIDKQCRSNTMRRILLLEEVAQHVGKVSHVFGKYTALVNEVGPNSERMSMKQEQELEQLSSQLVDVYEQVSMAEAKLLLLGEKRLEKALKLYTAKMAQFRRQYYPGRYSSAEQAGQLKQETSQMREQFYNVLSERYDHVMS